MLNFSASWEPSKIGGAPFDNFCKFSTCFAVNKIMHRRSTVTIRKGFFLFVVRISVFFWGKRRAYSNGQPKRTWGEIKPPHVPILKLVSLNVENLSVKYFLFYTLHYPCFLFLYTERHRRIVNNKASKKCKFSRNPLFVSKWCPFHIFFGLVAWYLA